MSQLTPLPRALLKLELFHLSDRTLAFSIIVEGKWFVLIVWSHASQD